MLGLAALSVAVVCVWGCGGGSALQEVSGTVTLQGAPLEEGVIEFHPREGVASKAGAPITKGSYKIPRESGLLPGKYKVIITAGDGVTPANPDEPPGPTGNIVSKDKIPPEYNVDSKQEVEVTKGGKNIFDFPIP
jgi:hypothetical protein